MAKKIKHKIPIIKEINPIKTEKELIQFTGRGLKDTKFNIGLVKFSFLYDVKKRWLKYLLTILIGLLMATVSTVLIQSTGLYTGGFGALFQGVARLVYSSQTDKMDKNSLNVLYNALFWGLYFLLNVPLTIFAYKKISKQFAWQSIVFNITTQGFGFLLGSGFFNESLAEAIAKFEIFGNTDTVNGILNTHNVKSVLFSPNYVPYFDNTTGEFQWDILFTQNPGEDDFEWVKSSITDDNISRGFLLFVYSTIYALFSSVCYTLVFILGGSTAGSDYITVYLSQVKNKDVGSMFIILNTINMTIGILLGSYISGGLVGDSTPVTIDGLSPSHANYWGWQYLFSANFFASLLWVFLNGTIINVLFPWHKLVRVEVFSSKPNEINAKLKSLNYIHPTTLIESIGGYSNKKGLVLTTICMAIELSDLTKIIRTVDDKCLISSSYIAGADGIMKMQKHTC